MRSQTRDTQHTLGWCGARTGRRPHAATFSFGAKDEASQPLCCQRTASISPAAAAPIILAIVAPRAFRRQKSFTHETGSGARSTFIFVFAIADLSASLELGDGDVAQRERLELRERARLARLGQRRDAASVIVAPPSSSRLRAGKAPPTQASASAATPASVTPDIRSCPAP